MRVNDLFAVHRLNAQGMKRAEALAEGFSILLDLVESGAEDGRDLALARTKLQEASFFAKRAMALNAKNQEREPIRLTDPHPAVPAEPVPEQESLRETVDRFMKHPAGGAVRFMTALKQYDKQRVLDLTPDERKDFHTKLQAALA